jgi:hypothetical protein
MFLADGGAYSAVRLMAKRKRSPKSPNPFGWNFTVDNRPLWELMELSGQFLASDTCRLAPLRRGFFCGRALCKQAGGLVGRLREDHYLYAAS